MVFLCNCGFEVALEILLCQCLLLHLHLVSIFGLFGKTENGEAYKVFAQIKDQTLCITGMLCLCLMFCSHALWDQSVISIFYLDFQCDFESTPQQINDFGSHRLLLAYIILF